MSRSTPPMLDRKSIVAWHAGRGSLYPADGARYRPRHRSETLERIFEPFFTTRRLGNAADWPRDTGIIADHGGALNVSSRPGFGSRLEAYVAAADTDVHEADDTGAPVPTGQGETILLVEDDRPLMLLGEEMVAYSQL